MRCVQLTSFPVEQEIDLEALEWRLGGWFAQRTYPVRLIALSRRFSVAPIIAELDRSIQEQRERVQLVRPLLDSVGMLLRGDPGIDPARTMLEMPLVQQAQIMDLLSDQPAVQGFLAQACAPDNPRALALWTQVAEGLAHRVWSVPWMKEARRFYEALGERHLRSSEYLMLTWEGSDVDSQSIATSLESVTRRPAALLPVVPPVIACEYSDEGGYLRPSRPGQPYLAVLLAYEVRDTWTATTLHELLNVPFDVGIAIDVRTLERNQAQRAAELAYNGARNALTGGELKDARAERVQLDAERVMHALIRESLHEVLVAVLVSGESYDDLRRNISTIRDRLGAQLRLTLINGAQGELLKLWGPTPRNALDLPHKALVMLSHGLGCAAGVLGFHRRGETNGLLYGIDAVRLAPLIFDLFADRQAAHMVILGKTGFGKTVFVNTTVMRAAAQAGYRVIMLDAFENAARLEQAADSGCRVSWIGQQQTINILDIVYDSDVDGGWLARQVQHVIGQLALLLGTPGTNDQGEEVYLPRALTIGERGVLDRALGQLYQQIDPEAALDDMPILSDLIAELETLVEHEAQTLARDLRLLIFGTEERRPDGMASVGRSFNGVTTVDWAFVHDINCFDFSAVEPILRPFYYAQTIGAINRYMRDPRRDRSRKTLLVIDEFGYAAQVAAVARLAADICKVARKYGIGLMVVDQNPLTFLGSNDGRRIFENAAAKMMFHLDDLPARQMGDAVGDLTPAHVAFLSDAGKGQCIAVFGKDVHVMHVELSPLEQRLLLGS